MDAGHPHCRQKRPARDALGSIIISTHGVVLNILLIIPPTDLAASYGNLKDFSNPVPSLGLAYLASMLRREGHQVSILDAYVREMSVEQVVQHVASQRPNVVGLSVLTTSAGVSEQVLIALSQTLPEVKRVAGNMHAAIFYEDYVKQGLVDAVVFREGEYTMLELVQAWETGADLAGVQGIAFSRDGQVVVNAPRPFIDNLDELPFPAWDLYDYSLYKTDPRTAVKGFEKQHETQILATRGCPNQCTFCSSRTDRSLGSRYRMRSPQNIVDEIECMLDLLGSHVFSFMDLAFPLVQKHAMAVCDGIIARGLHRKVVWFTECRVKPLEMEMLVKMKEAGCVRLCFGIESGNDSTLRRLKKAFTVQDIRRAVKMAHQAGLEVDGMFMLGLPGESMEEARQTVRLASEINVRFAIFNLFVPYPGCLLYDELNEQNTIHYQSWLDFSSYWTVAGGQPVYVPDGWSPEKLKEMQAWAMNKFYMRPAFILRQLRDFKPSMLGAYWRGFVNLLGIGR